MSLAKNMHPLHLGLIKPRLEPSLSRKTTCSFEKLRRAKYSSSGQICLPTRQKQQNFKGLLRGPPPSKTALNALSLQSLRMQSRHFTAAGWLAAFSIAATLGLLVYAIAVAYKRRRLDDEVQASSSKAKKVKISMSWTKGLSGAELTQLDISPHKLSLQEEALQADGYESEAFKLVLASVRQNITFQRALQSMREGNTTRAMVELHRVLEHNAICRKPISLDQYDESDIEGIYRLHLQNSELPLQYSTLLHLRQILNLSDRKAELLEVELKDTAYAFSI